MASKKTKRIAWSVTGAVLLIAAATLCIVRWKIWFGNPPEPAWQNDTITYQFHSFADNSVPGFVLTPQGWQDTLRNPEKLQLLVLGDVHNSLSRADYDTLCKRLPDIDGYAQLGDFVERGYFYYFQKLYAELQGSGLDSLPVLVCAGNHEYHKGIRRTIQPLWKEVFRMPLNGPADYLGQTYYVDFPAMRFIVIDTYGLQGLHAYTRVQTWVKRAMLGAGDRFVVVMMHEPVHSCGAGRQSVPIYLTFRRTLDKADLVIAGHDHNYSRRMPYINTNAATKYYLNKVNPKDERICSGHRLYEVLSVDEDTLRVQTYLMEDGSLYDEVEVIKTDGKRLVRSSFGREGEKIDLPDRYKDRNDAKVRRFKNRRKARSGCES